MLNKLTIKNVALIDATEINFTEGFNVLSGETGSGKSVIIESLNFVLGAKADRTLIRSAQTDCYVCAEFDVTDNQQIQSIFEELEFDKENLLIISRKFSVDGKNSIKINGNSATVGMLKKFTSALVDVHGQSEHFLLLSTSNQLKLLDKVGGNVVKDIKSPLSELYSEYKNVVSEIEVLGGDENQRAQRLDILNYQINEIESANLTDGEEEKLLENKEKILNQEKIINSLNGTKSALIDEGGVIDVLSNAVRLLSTVSSFGEEYQVLFDRLNSVFAESEDISDSISSIVNDFEFNQFNIEEIETRLELIKKLKRKYGANFTEIMEFLSNAQSEKDKLENFNNIFAKLIDKKALLEEKLYDLYINLSNARKDTAKKFVNNVLIQLKELGMAKANFSIEFSEIPEIKNCTFNSANGIDDIEFYFSANAGEPLKPLSNVISGGEMSRFMLAVKTQCSTSDISTYVFDEIDAGISGVVAHTVAQKLFNISTKTQVIAITHLPQISVFADNNLLITKLEENNKTTTYVKQLSKDEKVNEIIRLIGGEKGNIHAEQHAKDLIEQANLIKNNINN